jgi:hypothetical protein
MTIRDRLGPQKPPSTEQRHRTLMWVGCGASSAVSLLLHAVHPSGSIGVWVPQLVVPLPGVCTEGASRRCPHFVLHGNGIPRVVLVVMVSGFAHCFVLVCLSLDLKNGPVCG